MGLKLYGAEISPCVRAVLLTIEALELKGVEFVDVDLLNGGTQTAAFSAINPLQKVPTIQDGDLILWDSHAINAYIVSKYGKTDSLYPKDPKKRALVDAMNFFDTGFLFAGHDVAIKSIVTSPTPTSVDSQIAKPLEEAYAYLNTILEKRAYVAGSQLTIADFSIATTLSSSTSYLPLTPGKHDKVLAWYQTIKSLPYFAKKNPLHTVPVLEDGNFTLWDSHAINSYLVNKYATDDALYPKDIQKRALVDSMAHFDTGYLFGRGVRIIKAVLTQDNSVNLDQLKADLQEAYGLLELILNKRKFVAGDSMTIADFNIVATLSTTEVVVPMEKEYPRIDAWYAKMRQLPYYGINVKGVELFRTVFSMLISKL
ncbi:hypothetical protein D910_01718 [Dendroctonus ponderosae]|uniref:Glutathione S-transferase n=1 Tax=Dendroctonus ponderosae TaxID=77166 RepID=U4TS53_DENPD|nr:hypothetical protein D910_01718 [Dendroctonus ponderosae]